MMDEREIKKPNSLFPKMFKTFTLYIFATLLVFFGYVQIFGDVSPQVIQLPTDSTDADDETYFSSFVQNMLNFKNIDTDVSLSFSNADKTLNLALVGNVVYAESGISLDLDLVYNEQTFDVQATYFNSNLFLTIDESTYMFDASSVSGFGSSNLDLMQMLNFVTAMLDIDLSFVDEIGEFLGIDFSNFNPNDLLAMLKIEEKMLEDGGYNFKIKLGSAIEAILTCNEKFNIVSVQTNNILIKNNALNLSADVHKMNNTDVQTGEQTSVDVFYEKTGNEIDLTGIAEYVNFAKNLYANNQFVKTNMTLKVGENEYEANLLVDTAESTKLKFVTNIENVGVEIVYANENVYIDVDGLKLRLALKDLPAWQETIDEILLEHMGKNTVQLLKEVLSKFVDFGEGQFDFNQILKQILSSDVSGMDLSSYLPIASSRDENAYAISWENGLIVEMTQEDSLLRSISVGHSKFQLDVNFEVSQSGVEVSGEYLDLIKAKNLLEYANAGIFEFDFALSYNDWNVCGEENFGTFKFYNGEIEISCSNICGEPFSVRLHTDEISGKQTAYIAYGNMKIKVEVPQNSSSEKVDVFAQLGKLTSGYFGFQLDFGVFAELLNILENYSLQDYLNNMIVDVSSNPNEIVFSISDKQQITTAEILKAKISFEQDLLHSISLQVYDVVEAQIKINHTDVSTIKQFDADEYQDYSENFIEGVFDSLQASENVYAFASDIAIRYSNNTFYGKLTAMVVKSQKAGDGVLKEVYVPAISLYTTSLGLSTYIYLIDSTVYIDINGLQIQADLNETTINEIMSFVTENFGQFLTQNESAEDAQEDTEIPPVVEAFKVIIPALDRIYGKWVSYLLDEQTINGIQIELGNYVSRENIIKQEETYNEETGEYDIVEYFSNDVADYGGQSNVLMYSENSWFYNIIMQAYVQNYQNTIMPTKVILGANIHDPNTVVYDNYDNFLLSCEEAVTSNLNFAVYLTNISVGEYVGNLGDIFFSNIAEYQNIYAVKSNISDFSYNMNDGEEDVVVTNLEDFNSYKTLLGITETIYNYSMAMEYQINIRGSMTSEASTTTIGGDVTLQVGDLTDEMKDESGFYLFKNKFLNVFLDGLDIRRVGTSTSEDGSVINVDEEHLLDLRYRSSSEDPAIYVTYSHSNYADGTDLTNNLESGNKFQAKISNNNLSEIIAMVLAFAKIDLGEALTSGLNLPQNTTDFTFLQNLLGLDEEIDADDAISKADGILSSVENVTSMIKQVSLQTLDDLTTVLTLKVDLNAQDEGLAGRDVAVIKVVLNGAENEDGEVVYTPNKIEIENLVLGGQTLNLTITVGKFDESNFKYFEKNPLKDADGNDTHIDFSEISSFVDVAVNSLNTRGILLKGETTVSITLVGDIEVSFEVYIGLDENNKLYVHAEVSDNYKYNITASDSLTPKPRYTTYIMAGGGFDKRVSILEYKDEELVVTQKTYGIKTTVFSKKYDEVRGGKGTSDNWVYTKDEIGDNVMKIMVQALGLSDYAYSLIEYAIKKIEAHPTVERAMLGFEYNADSSSYSMEINSENLMGMSGIQNMTIEIGTSKEYNTTFNGIAKTAKFIDSVSTKLVIGNNIVSVPITLTSINTDGAYTTMDGIVLNTSEYYRQRYVQHNAA